MTVVVTAEKFLHRHCFRTETVHTKVVEFWHHEHASIAHVQHLASPVYLFPVYKPNQRFLTVINITAVSARRNETYVIGLQKLFTQQFIACGSECNGFQENLYVTDLDKLSSKHCTLAVRP